MLLDGVGVPHVQVDLAGRQVLVVAAGYDHVADLGRLRRFIREYRPRLIGVGAGADALLAAGHQPHLIVGNPAEISDEALTCGADVVVPAFADGHAPGLHRVQDLGAGAVTFPSSANPEDLALLLAHHHGASMIITVGLSASMAEFLDRGRSGSNASTFLTRLQTGDGRRRAGGGGAAPEPDLGVARDALCSSRPRRRSSLRCWCRRRVTGCWRGCSRARAAAVELVRGGVGDLSAVSRGVDRRGVPGAGHGGRARSERGSDRVLAAVSSQRDDLGAQVTRLSAERDTLAARERAADEFASRVGPAAVRGLLAGQTVALVVAGADVQDRDAVTGLIENAGGTVTGRVELTDAVGDPARADQCAS